MSVLDGLIYGFRRIFNSAGTELPTRSDVQFVGGDVTDDPVNDRVVVDVSGGGPAAVIFDGGTTTKNLRSDRDAHQSPIDNTKNGIVNLGSDTGETNGVTGSYSTLLGGDQGEADSAYAVVAGGYRNRAVNGAGNGDYSVVAGGKQNVVTNAASSAIGGGEQCSIDGAHHAAIAGGKSCLVSTQGMASPAHYARAGGKDAVAYLPAQEVVSGGAFADPGDCQASRYMVSGTSTNGSAAHLADANAAECPVSHPWCSEVTYAVTAKCVAHRTDNAGSAMWIDQLLVKVSGATVTIPVQAQTHAAANGEAWTVVYSVASQGIRATFTGTAGHTVRAAVLFDWASIASN